MELEKMNNLAANYFCTLFNSLGYLLFKTTCRTFGNFVCILQTKINLAPYKGRTLRTLNLNDFQMQN